MTASFIKKNDGNFYMRLTGDTTSVKFGAVSNAGNTYTFSVAGSVVVSKPDSDPFDVTYYTSSVDPVPAGGTLDDGRFPGAESLYSYAGSGTRDYLLSFTSSGGGTAFYLGGASLSWGGYAYPGDGYITNPLAAGVKVSGSWRNAGNIFVKQSGTWKEVITAWVKQGGTWRKFYQNFGNSSWINMLENTDDAIDFGVQVIPLWSWPVSSFDSNQTYYPDAVTSTAVSDIVTAPVTQTVELTINASISAGGYPNGALVYIRLIRISDSYEVFSLTALANGTSNVLNPTTVNAGESYRFESTVTVPAGYIGTNLVSVQREDSVIVYSNSATAFLD